MLLLGACSQSPQPADSGIAEDAVRPAKLDPDNPAAPGESVIFPWSVVPGGIGTREAAQRAVAEDPIVKEHYKAVNIAKLRTEQLAKPKSAYVSYRKGDSIYWTRNPVLLKAGETILTDGDSVLRGRCGNMVSDTPRSPVAPVHLEPPAAAMEIPVTAARLVAAIPAAVGGAPTESTLAVRDRAPSVNTSVLPSPEPVQGLPGYAPQGAVGGFLPVTGGPTSGGGASLGPPPESTAPDGPPEPRPVQPPVPIVITPLTPPSTPLGPPGFQPPPDWPTRWYPPPPDSPLPPPPVLYPPPDHPPPSVPPPSVPPPSGPPPSGPPPSGPPPSGPPPSGPPPSGPPPGDPPPHDPPPPSDPPFDPPPLEPPPSIPEPTAFVLIGLGMIGLGLHLSRQKN